MRRLAEFLLYCGVAVLLMLYSSTIIGAALTALFGNMGNVPPAVLRNLMFVSPLFPLLLGAVAAIRLKSAGVDVGRLIGFSRSTMGSDALLGAAIGAFGLAAALLSLFILAPYAAVPPFAQIPVTGHLYFATIGAIIPGICEELFFRGLLFKLARPAPTWLIVTASALAFSLWHIATPIYLVHTFFLGLVLGWVVARRGRLAPAIVGHTLANASFGVWAMAGLPLP